MATQTKTAEENTFSLLGKTSKYNINQDNDKPKRCMYKCFTLCLLVIIFIFISLVVCFADFIRPIRCTASDIFNIGFVECATPDKLESLSKDEKNGTVHQNITIHLPIDQIHNISKNICGFYGDTNVTYIQHNARAGCAGDEIVSDENEPETEEVDIRQLAEHTYDVAYEIMTDYDELWVLDKGTSWKTGRVYSKTFEHIGRVSRLEVEFEATVEQIHTLMIDEIENLPSWEPTMAEVKVVEQLSDDMYIVHLMTGPAMGGLISGRDFVNMRYWKTTENNVTVMAEVAIEHPGAPESYSHVRAYHRPGGFMFGPVKNKPNKVFFITAASADIGMWMPQFLLDKAKARAMMSFVENMNAKLRQMKRTERRGV